MAVKVDAKKRINKPVIFKSTLSAGLWRSIKSI